MNFTVTVSAPEVRNTPSGGITAHFKALRQSQSHVTPMAAVSQAVNKFASKQPSNGFVATSTTLCKYFPNCVNLNCPFLHPKPNKLAKSNEICRYVDIITILMMCKSDHEDCRNYPNCTFGSSCAFLHPKMCKFGLACNNPTCPHIHPSPVQNCRNGYACTNENCTFGHPPVRKVSPFG